MAKGSTALAADLDALYPAATSIGYIALLDSSLEINRSFTVDTGNNRILQAIHNLVTTSRIQFNLISGTLPEPLITGRDYWVIKYDNDEYYIADTLNDAQLSNPITLLNAGSGSFETNEQPLSKYDALTALINHEVKLADSPTYSRPSVSGLAAASKTAFGTTPAKASKSLLFSIDPGGGNPNIYYRYALVIKGGSSTVGDYFSGSPDEFYDEGSLIEVVGGTPRPVNMTFELISS